MEYFFNRSIVVLHEKSNRCLLKTTAIILNFVVKTSQIWLVLVGSFVSSANQKPFVICSRVTKLTLVLQENYTPLSANQNWVIFSCNYIITQLAFLKYFKCSRFPGCAVKCKTGFLCVLSELIAHDVKHALQNKWRYIKHIILCFWVVHQHRLCFFIYSDW